MNNIFYIRYRKQFFLKREAKTCIENIFYILFNEIFFHFFRNFWNAFWSSREQNRSQIHFGKLFKHFEYKIDHISKTKIIKIILRILRNFFE